MSRRISRRAVLGGAAALVAGGGVTAALVAASRDDDASASPEPDETGTGPGSSTSEPTAAADTPTAEPTQPVDIGLAPTDPNSIQRQMFGPSDALPWTNGLYFKQPDGSVEGFHLEAAATSTVQYEVHGRGEYVHVRRTGADENLGLVRDREGSFALAWDTTRLALVGARPGVLLFREAGGGEELFIAGTDGAVRRPLTISAVRQAFVSADGRAAFLSGKDGAENVYYWVELESGSAVELARGAGAFAESNDGSSILLTTGGGTGERRLRWISWEDGSVTGDGTVEVDETAANPGQFFVFEGGESLVAREVNMRGVVVSAGPGGLRHWPAVEVVDLQAETAVYRIRSMALSGFDFAPQRRWLFESTGFTAHYLVRPDLGPESGHGWGVYRTPDQLAAVPSSEPGQPTERGPVTPSPWDAALLAGPNGTFDLRTGNWNRIVLPEGAGHMDPFSARPGETVYLTPHLGHGSPGPYPLLPPVLERPPFDDRMLFRVARTGDCLNLRTRPSLDAESLVCLADGTEVELAQDVTTAGVDEDASTRYGEDGEGIWAFVKAGEQRGWVSIQYLDWAIGEPLQLS